MHRTLSTTALALSLALAAGLAHAQDFSISFNPRSGDVWVDRHLGDMNTYGMRHRESFIDEMVRYYGAPRPLVTDLLGNRRWAPGDVYYACAIGQIIGRPCQYVVNEWDRNHGQGWGVVAQRLGIKPGSAEFHRLKRGFVPTYDRWSRPIQLDADLQRHFPNRGNAGNQGRGQAQPGNRGQGNAPANRGQGNQPANRGQQNRANQGPQNRGNQGQGNRGQGNQGRGNPGRGNPGRGG